MLKKLQKPQSVQGSIYKDEGREERTVIGSVICVLSSLIDVEVNGWCHIINP